MNKLVALVLAGCVALAAGQKNKIELPAPLDGATNDYDVPGVELPTCNYLPIVFEDSWKDTTATSGCNADTATTLWAAAKVAVTPDGSPAWFSTYGATTTLDGCNTAAEALTGGAEVVTDGKKICTYVADIANACACARLGCVTPKVNAAVTSVTADTCNHFAAGACGHYKSRVDSTCTAAWAVSARPAFTGGRTAQFNTRPAAFPDNCAYACPTAGTTTPAPSTPSGAAGVSSSAGVVIAAAAAALGASML